MLCYICVSNCVSNKATQNYKKMEIAKPTFSIYLDTRQIKSNEKYPVKLRITFKRQRDYVSLSYDLTEDEFNKLSVANVRNEHLKEIKILNNNLLSNADEIAKRLVNFNFADFKKQFLETEHDKEQNRKNVIDVYHAIEKYIEHLNNNGRVTTASSYQSSLNSFKGFVKMNFLWHD